MIHVQWLRFLRYLMVYGEGSSATPMTTSDGLCTVRKLSRKKLRCPGLFQIGRIYSAYEEQKISTLYQLHTSVIFAVACLTAY